MLDLLIYFLDFHCLERKSFVSLFRPFVEFISAPFWSVVSTRFRQAKNILLMSIFSWIVFTVAIGLIKPPPHSCWREMNATHQLIERVGYTTTSSISPAIKLRIRRQAVNLPTVSSKILDKTKELNVNEKMTTLNNSSTSTIKNLLNKTTVAITQRRKANNSSRTRTTTRTTTISNEYEDDDVESEEEDEPVKVPSRTSSKSTKLFSNTPASLQITKPQKTIGNPLWIKHTNLSLVKPLASPVLYDQKDVRNVFMVFLLLIIIGEFFSAPAITLAVR